MNQPNFDRIARFYCWLEYLTLGQLLEIARTYPLPRLATCRQALILGAGDGRFTARLLAANLDLQAHAVDLSPIMLKLLRQRVSSLSPGPPFRSRLFGWLLRPSALHSRFINSLPRHSRLRTFLIGLSFPPFGMSFPSATKESALPRLHTYQADARNFTPPTPPDLVITQFFLDCLTQSEVDSLVTRLAPTLAPQALWLVSDFRIPPGMLHWPARVFIRLLYLAFRILTGLRVTQLPDHTTPLLQAGFTPIAEYRMLFGILTTELWRR